ncbi:MAG: hypothetical protein BAJALOKI3v1_240013 [Promethearchaeota archaeon]|nr:MAG: hypothetical protein BAJALOKI3v1_240013 [Candidatus Lokiarchaeota archaeon]
MSKNCAKCDESAITKCSECKIPLCKDHAEHGYSIAPQYSEVKCYECNEKSQNRIKLTGAIISIALFISTFILLFYFGTHIP